MNYFELFDLPVQLKVNKHAVKRKYFELSKKHHPDYHINATESEQHTVLETTALLNKGLKTLTHEDDTLHYVLQLKGLVQEDEKYQLPADFLMEMMELNEELADADFENNPNEKIKIHQQLVQLEKEIYAPVKNTIENYKEGVTTPQELLQVKAYYFKKKYLHRLHQQLAGKL